MSEPLTPTPADKPRIIRVMGWVRYDELNRTAVKDGRARQHPLRVDHTVTCLGNEEPYTAEFFDALSETCNAYFTMLSTRDAAVNLVDKQAIGNAIDFICQYNDANAQGPDKSDAWVLVNHSVNSVNSSCIELHGYWDGIEPSAKKLDK